MIARHVDPRLAEVTLRSPPPLDTEMEVREEGPGVRLFDGETLIAEARAPEPLELELPEPVTLAEAEAGREASPLHRHSPYASCFVCGPERRPGRRAAGDRGPGARP